MRSTCVLSASLFLAAGVLAAQPMAGFGPTRSEFVGEKAAPVHLRGEVVQEGGGSLDHYQVEIVSQGQGMHSERVPVSSQGGFELRGVLSGHYMLRVTTQDGTVVKQEFLNVNPYQGSLTVQLPARKVVTGGGVVSVARLSHKIPKKALKEYEKGSDLLKRRKLEEAELHLTRATELDSEYFEAYNDLGVLHMARQSPADALNCFEKAFRLDPGSVTAANNVAISLLMLERPKDAELNARRAVQLDPGDTKARYALGLSLFYQRQWSDEALDSLRRSAPAFPKARLALAEIHMQKGASLDALKELRVYLQDPAAPHRAEVQAVLQRAEQQAALAQSKDAGDSQ